MLLTVLGIIFVHVAGSSFNFFYKLKPFSLRSNHEVRQNFVICDVVKPLSM